MLKDLFLESARHAIPGYLRFEAEARSRGARFIEAEHMLLALVAKPETEVGRLLIDAGLDHEKISSMLDDEIKQTLAFAGVQPIEIPATTAAEGAISLGTSAKAALRRAIHNHHEIRRRRTRVDSFDVLIGILGAELGTVPRAFAIASIDRSELIARARDRAGVTAQTC